MTRACHNGILSTKLEAHLGARVSTIKDELVLAWHNLRIGESGILYRECTDGHRKPQAGHGFFLSCDLLMSPFDCPNLMELRCPWDLLIWYLQSSCPNFPNCPPFAVLPIGTGCPNVRLILRTATLCGLYEYKESGRSPVPPSIVIIFAIYQRASCGE